MMAYRQDAQHSLDQWPEWDRLRCPVMLLHGMESDALSPRTLLGPPDEAADQKTLRALAKVEERHDTEQVDVHFHNGDPASRPAGEPRP